VPSDALDEVLQDLLRKAGITDAARFLPFVTARLGEDNLALLAAAPAADLGLVWRVLDGDTAALAELERRLASIRPAIAQLGATVADIDETLQRLRIQLLVGSSPGIAAYKGRGSLAAWLRVIAVREGVRVLTDRGHLDPIGDDRLLESFLPDADDEHTLVGADLRAAFRTAFEAAVRSLEPRDRLLLRQHTVDDLSIDELATLHGADRSTVARWLSAARSRLSRATERRLQEGSGAATDEVLRMYRGYLSRLDASVERLLTVE
jgi:RNA polymerase sigma-70 factor (ECF subfamily)